MGSMTIGIEQSEVKNPLRIVRDGQKAINYLSGAGKFVDRQKFPLPYLFLLDLKMPRKTGMDVLEWLREQPELRCLPGGGVFIVRASEGYCTSL